MSVCACVQDRLSKKINKKVMGMIENAENEYAELNRKRQVRHPSFCCATLPLT